MGLAALAVPFKPFADVITGDACGQRHKETGGNAEHGIHLLPVARRAAWGLYHFSTKTARRRGKICLAGLRILVQSAN